MDAPMPTSVVSSISMSSEHAEYLPPAAAAAGELTRARVRSGGRLKLTRSRGSEHGTGGELTRVRAWHRRRCCSGGGCGSGRRRPRVSSESRASHRASA
eukprot:5423870-Prymnesium_polylepis.1